MAGLFGTGGPDSIAGTALDDLVSAGAGDDTPIGGQGNDPLFAGDAWAAFGGFYDRYISPGAPLTQAQARAAAEAFGPGAALVSLSSAAEAAFVLSLVTAGADFFWTGGFQPPGSPEPGAAMSGWSARANRARR